MNEEIFEDIWKYLKIYGRYELTNYKFMHLAVIQKSPPLSLPHSPPENAGIVLHVVNPSSIPRNSCFLPCLTERIPEYRVRSASLSVLNMFYNMQIIRKNRTLLGN